MCDENVVYGLKAISLFIFFHFDFCCEISRLLVTQYGLAGCHTGKPELNSDRHCAAPLNITAPLPFPSNNFLIDQSKNQYDHKSRAVRFWNDTLGIAKYKLGTKTTLLLYCPKIVTIARNLREIRPCAGTHVTLDITKFVMNYECIYLAQVPIIFGRLLLPQLLIPSQSTLSNFLLKQTFTYVWVTS